MPGLLNLYHSQGKRTPIGGGSLVPQFNTAAINGGNINVGNGTTINDLHDNIFTVDGWFLITLPNSAVQMIADKGFGANGWQVSLTGQNYLYFYVACITTSATGSSSSTVSLNTWHHYAGFFDDAGDRRSWIALDGVWSTGTAGTGVISSDAAKALRFGINSGATQNTASAKFGWQRLSNNDRLNHGVNFVPPARIYAPPVDGNVVELWKLNEGVGTVARASVSVANNGTISKGTWVVP